MSHRKEKVFKGREGVEKKFISKEWIVSGLGNLPLGERRVPIKDYPTVLAR